MLMDVLGFETHYLNLGKSEATNKKAKVYKKIGGVELLQSYDTIILIYDPANNTITYNNDFYKCSHTTNRHRKQYLRELIPSPQKEIYLNDSDFNKLLIKLVGSV